MLGAIGACGAGLAGALLVAKKTLLALACVGAGVFVFSAGRAAVGGTVEVVVARVPQKNSQPRLPVHVGLERAVATGGDAVRKVVDQAGALGVVFHGLGVWRAGEGSGGMVRADFFCRAVYALVARAVVAWLASAEKFARACWVKEHGCVGVGACFCAF